MKDCRKCNKLKWRISNTGKVDIHCKEFGMFLHSMNEESFRKHIELEETNLFTQKDCTEFAKNK
jgi:phage FluMu protein Com